MLSSNKQLQLLILLLISFHSYSQKDFGHNRIKKSDANYWLGVDFYFNRLVDARQMGKDEEIRTKYCPAWLGVFDKFETEENIKNKLDVKGFVYRADLTAYRYKEMTEFVVPVKRGVSEKELYEYLANLKLPLEEGNAFILLPINMIKTEGKCELWLICFDLADRSILGSCTIKGKVNGYGMTSYWGESLVNGWRRMIRKYYK